jgi:hypothetical protein
MEPRLDSDGAELFPTVLDGSGLAEIERFLPSAPGAGVRIYRNRELALWLLEGPVGALLRGILGPTTRPVRAILFNKTAQTNWALGWHQDRTICVRKRIEVPGFRHWTKKAGALHVEPPFGLLERMLTARIHLDPVPEGNAPLLIAPGSHRLGRLEEHDIARVVRECGTYACLSAAGDVWLYRTPILHSSERATSVSGRRVVQVDYAADVLPVGLEWLGVA